MVASRPTSTLESQNHSARPHPRPRPPTSVGILFAVCSSAIAAPFRCGNGRIQLRPPFFFVMASSDPSSTTVGANGLPEEVVTCLQNARFVSISACFQTLLCPSLPIRPLLIPCTLLVQISSSCLVLAASILSVPCARGQTYLDPFLLYIQHFHGLMHSCSSILRHARTMFPMFR